MINNRTLSLEHCQPAMEVPFTLSEYRQRLQRIRERMSRDEIDLLYLTAPESLFYVSGYACEWYQAQGPKQWPATSGIAVHVDHDDFILFDTPSEQIMSRYVTIARDIRVFPMTSRRDGIAFVLDELSGAGWLGGTVGLELYSYRPNPVVSARFRDGLSTRGCRVVDGSDVLRDVRWVKSAQEIAYIKQAGQIMDVGLSAARQTIAPGVTELDVYGEIIRAMSRAGGENPGITLPVLSGAKANCGHALAGRKQIIRGEQVNVDVCGVYNRYHCNAARSFYVGEPPAEVASFFQKSARSFDVIANLLRPNLPVAELVGALNDYYRGAGLLGDAAWVGGYELGIAFPPDWVGNFVYELADTDSRVILEPGTVVNYESQFFGPELSGLTYLIDTLLFEHDTARIMSKIPRELIILEC